MYRGIEVVFFTARTNQGQCSEGGLHQYYAWVLIQELCSTNSQALNIEERLETPRKKTAQAKRKGKIFMRLLLPILLVPPSPNWGKGLMALVTKASLFPPKSRWCLVWDELCAQEIRWLAFGKQTDKCLMKRYLVELKFVCKPKREDMHGNKATLIST